MEIIKMEKEVKKEQAKETKEDEKLKEKKQQKAKKPTEKEIIIELTETLQRTQAEFENYRKRVDKEKGEFVKYAKAELIQKLLSIIDTFEIALKNTNDKEKFVKGMEIVYVQLFSILESEGVRPIEALGKKFDPYLHEVMLKEKSDKDENIVLEELQKGYMLNGKVLRHSKVKINEKIEEKKESNNNKK
jgi:molecular chaperone GrpE|tara:strand:+ start:90 stop:656 length:567 start_codon:yes stop_codon:yes gene_type:complete